MKPTVILAALFLAASLFAGGPEEHPTPSETPAAQEAGPWPQKGDTVFVSAALEWIQSPAPFAMSLEAAGPRHKEVLAPCAPLTVVRRKDEPLKLRTSDDMLRPIYLIGDAWIPRLHRTAKLCLAFLKEKGQPRVQSKIAGMGLTPFSLGFQIADDPASETAKENSTDHR